jgi:hypothetical protein
MLEAPGALPRASIVGILDNLPFSVVFRVGDGRPFTLSICWGHVSVLVDEGDLQEVSGRMESTAMKTIQFRIGPILGNGGQHSQSARPVVRRKPSCELLEGRQLLSTAASMMASGMPPFGGSGSFPGGSGTPPTAAQIAQFDGKGGPGGFGAHGAKAGSFSPKAMSATLKADLTTLQTDETQLQSELPTSVTSAVTADQAVISKALSSLSPSGRTGKHMSPPSASSSGTSSPPSITAMLEKSGISATQASQIATDFQTYQTDLETTDPTLQTKITADQTAITNAGGPTLPTGAIGFGIPGQPMNAPASR